MLFPYPHGSALRPMAEDKLAAIRGARMVILERSGHAPFVEEPERFSREIAAFLTG